MKFKVLFSVPQIHHETSAFVYFAPPHSPPFVWLSPTHPSVHSLRVTLLGAIMASRDQRAPSVTHFIFPKKEKQWPQLQLITD